MILKTLQVIKKLSGDVLARAWGKTMGTDRKQFDMFFDKMLDGFAYHKIIVNKAGNPTDYVFLEVNSAFEKMTQLKRENIIGKRVSDVLPGIEKDPAEWIGVYGRVALTGEPAQFENYAESLGKWYRVVVYCPSKGHFVTLFEDITERKKAEFALSASEIKFRTVANFTYDWEYWIGTDGVVLFMSPSCERFTGYTPDEFTRNPKLLNQIVHPEDQALFDAHYGLVSTDKSHEIDFRIISQDGKIHWVSHICQSVFDDEGKWIGRRVSNREITKRKRVEEALRESEERLNRSQEIAHLGSWELDLKENRLTWSDEVYRIFGLKPQEFAATYEAFLASVYPDDRAAVDAAYSGSLKEGKDGYEIEHRVVRKYNGEIRIVHEKCTHIRDKSGQIVRSVGMVHDITESKKAEEALSKLNEELEERVQKRTEEVLSERKRLYNVLETLPAYVILLDRDYCVPFANKVFRERFGESKGKPCYDFLFNRNSPCENCETYKVLKTNGPHRWEWTGPDGRDYDIYDFPFVEADGSTLILEMGIDITERKRAEKQIRDASVYARSLIEASLDPLLTISTNGKITDVNVATELATGCSREELIGSDFSKYFTEPEKARIGYKQVFAEGYVRDYPLAIIHKSGKTTDVLYNATIYTNEAGEMQGVFAAARDITELKKVEAQAQEAAKKLKDSERLAAIGATAGMVGHDIRNPLQAIISDVYLAKTELASLPESDEKKNTIESLQEIEKNIDYVNKIVQDLQDFARPLNPKAEEADLKLILTKLFEKNNWPDNIELSVKIENSDKKITTDPYYINRIMCNLVTNAVQAMPNGGKLAIHAFQDSKDLVMVVKDTGVGIPKDVQFKMFTLMFTTKAKGQGFGLPVVKRLTESLGGTVAFESEVGIGTTFTVRLPLNR